MKNYFIILSLLCILSPVYGSSASWEEVLSDAKINNPTLKKAEDSLKTARQNYYSAYTNFLPQLSATVSQNQSEVLGKKITNKENETIINSGMIPIVLTSTSTKTETIMQYTRDNKTGISASLSLFSGFADYSNVKMKKCDLDIAEQNYRRAYSDTIYNLKKKFFQLLWAQQMIQLTNDILKQRQKNLGMIQLKYDSGTEDLGSLSRVRVDKYNAEYEVSSAMRYLKTAQIQLINSIGRNDLSEIEVQGDFITENFKPDDNTKGLIKTTPEYLIAKYNLDKAKYNIKLAKSTLFPSVSFSWSSTKSGADWPPLDNSWNLGINASYPFFPGGKNIYDIKIAILNQKVAEKNMLETEYQLSTRLLIAFNDVFDKNELCNVLKKIFEATKLQSDIVTQKYVNGLASYIDWYSVENDFINSKKNYLNSQRDASVSQAAWKNQLGSGE
ncbi:MAG: TolC family protein [Elusimicrobia bacterium]|nr:TolC family protein [Elusimicrobiota bacterium]